MINQYVSVYVPSTKEVNKPISSGERIIITGEVVLKFTNSFGGCTTQDCRGAWKDSNDCIVYEDITIVKSFTDNPNALAIAREIALSLKKELTQESVTIESNDGIEFI
jgi:hypothetical protein